MVLLSIIIPVYNVECYIGECLTSILKQFARSNQVEIIVVNDGTLDNSMEVVKGLNAQYDNPITIINQQNQGLSCARNNGLKAAKGDYVWFVDSDDFIHNDAFETIFQYISEYPNAEVFSSIMTNYYEDTNVYRISQINQQIIWKGFDYLKARLPNGAAQRFVYKRSFLLENNLQFVPKILHEDAVWGFEMLYIANKVVLMQKPIYCYRIRTNGSIMSSIKIRSAYDLITGYEKLIEFMNVKVKECDRKMYRGVIYGMILTLLDFCKHLRGTDEYNEFMCNYKSFIKSESKFVWKSQLFNWKALLTAINPDIIVFALRLRAKINLK